jgi:hypothetical protein
MKKLLASLVLTAASTAALASTYQWTFAGRETSPTWQTICLYAGSGPNRGQTYRLPVSGYECPGTINTY